MLNHKWTKSMRNAAVGDIVYLAEAENDDPTYRLGQVVEACPGEDGCVRTVKVRYTNPGKPKGKRSPPKTTTRPIHKVAVVVPAEYMFEDDTCDNVVGSRCPKKKARPPVERGDGSGRVSGEGLCQVEGGGARERGSPARGPQEARKTQKDREAVCSRDGTSSGRAGGCGDAPGGRGPGSLR
jgi:hypothetical protein